MKILKSSSSLVLVACALALAGCGDQRAVTFTVNDKERGSSASGDPTLIYTDKGVFKNVDDMWNDKHNSSDVYGQLTRGHKYECTVVGKRSRRWSTYPNILECKEVDG